MQQRSTATNRKRRPAIEAGRAGRLPLLAGALCLDFANTTSGRGGPRCIEHLHRYEHLLIWSRHAGLISNRTASGLRRAASRMPAAAQQALADGKAMRSLIFTVCAALSQNKAPSPSALAALGRMAAAAAGQRKLVSRRGRIAWKMASPSDDLASVLVPIALSAADLLVTMDRRRLKQCPGEHCGWLFLDETKSRTRRWCEMRVCGSRAKVRRFRRLRRRVGSPAKS
jgi:predicted RNA-binding Zn ribbon-like protein